MSRIIKTQNGARMREKALKLIGSAIYEYKSTNYNADMIDISSYIALLLEQIETSVQETCLAWERREYWVKADQFRAEWKWVGELKKQLVDAVQNMDHQQIGEVLEKLQKNQKIYESTIKSKKGIEYVGSYTHFKKKYG